MNDVQPLVLFQLDANLKAQLYFNPQGGQCFAGTIKYNNPEAPFRLRQIVLSGKFLDATPPVYGDTVVELESVDAKIIIDPADPYIMYADLTITRTNLQLVLYEVPELNKPDYKIYHGFLNCKIRPVNSGFIIDSVYSTQPLSVSQSPRDAEEDLTAGV